MRDAPSGAGLLLVGMLFLLLGSCAGAMQRYSGPLLPADRTAIIKTGFYASMERCDDVRPGPFQSSGIAVLPGKHTVEVAFRRQVLGNRVLYSEVTGLVTFVAEAGHTYSVNANLVAESAFLGLIKYNYDWRGYVVDQGTGETIAVTTDALPTRTEWIPNAQLFSNPF